MADSDWVDAPEDEWVDAEAVQPPADPLMRALSPPPPAPDGPSELEAGLRGTAQGASMGFSDELTGAALGLGRALPESLGGMGENIGEAYRRERDAARAANEAARAAHPGVYLGGEVVGGIGSSLATGGAGAGLKGALALGAASGLGHAEGTAGEQALQTVGGAGLSGVGYGIGRAVSGAVSKISRPVRDFVARKLGTARADVLTHAQEKAAKATASELGKYRAAVQSASRDLEVLAREADNLPAGHPLKTQIEDLLRSERGMALREMVAGNKVTSAPERLAEMAELRASFEAAKAAEPGVVAAAQGEGLRGTIGRAVAPRVMRYAQRFAPSVVGTAVGGYAGHEIGGPEGAMIGGVLGAGAGSMAGAALGAPGTAFANMMRDPKVREHAWGAVQKIVGTGEGLERWLPTLMSAAARSEQSLAVTNYVLQQNDPEYRQAVENRELGSGSWR